jgi:UDP-3-O-[3-hydroxymyristoyl] glucosamine N-acyltransferase
MAQQQPNQRSSKMSGFTAKQIATCVEGELIGPADVVVRGVRSLDEAQSHHLTFVRDHKNMDLWRSSKSSLVLISEHVQLDDQQIDPGRAMIRVQSADVALAQVLALFLPPKVAPPAGVHPGAVVADSTVLGENIAIAAGCVIGESVTIGSGCILHPRVTIMDRCTLGSDCELYPGVVLREDCELGDRVTIHANTVIGADGFGYCPTADGSGIMKIPHISGVRIGHDVEIGATTCIDRGKFTPTTIGDGTKIDNLCQIGHNCRIGRNCLIAGQVGLAGSVTVGDGVMIGGNVGVKDQITIGDGASLAASAAVMQDVPAGASWGGYPAQETKQALREIAAIRKLPDLIKTLRQQRSNKDDK